MILCITAATEGPAAGTDPRFGRAPFFAFANSETGEIQIEPNGFISGSGGVGSKVGEFMAKREIDAVITGHVGPNAFRVLQAAGIAVYESVAPTVADALSEFNGGTLQKVTQPGASHAGSGR